MCAHVVRIRAAEASGHLFGQAAPRRSAGIFTVQGAGGLDQEPYQHAQRLPLGEAQTHGFTFVSTQVRVPFRSYGNTLAHPGLQCCTWS